MHKSTLAAAWQPNLTGVTTLLITVLTIVCIVVAIMVASKAHKGNTPQAAKAAVGVLIALFIAALGIGGFIVAIGTNLVNFSGITG